MSQGESIVVTELLTVEVQNINSVAFVMDTTCKRII